MALTNEQIVALAKVVKEAQLNRARPNVAAGTYPIDMLLKITGSINVGEDYSTPPTVSIPLKKALALFILYAGLSTSREAMDALTKALYDSIELTGTSERADFGEQEAAVDALIAEVQRNLIDKLPPAYRTGPVTTKLNVAEVAVRETATA